MSGKGSNVQGYECPVCKDQDQETDLMFLGEPIFNKPKECTACGAFYYLTLTRQGIRCHKQKAKRDGEADKSKVGSGRSSNQVIL